MELAGVMPALRGLPLQRARGSVFHLGDDRQRWRRRLALLDYHLLLGLLGGVR